MTKLLCILFFAAALSACSDKSSNPPAAGSSGPSAAASQADDATNGTLGRIWSAYTTQPDNANHGVRWVHVTGKLLQSGTVPPSALNSSVTQRLPAYLACYDFTMVIDGMGDTPSNMCIYYIDNPTMGTYGMLTRGKEYLDQLNSAMDGDGFTPN